MPSQPHRVFKHILLHNRQIVRGLSAHTLMQVEESESKPFAAQQVASPARGLRYRKAPNAPKLLLPSAPHKGVWQECLAACEYIAMRQFLHRKVSNACQ